MTKSKSSASSIVVSSVFVIHLMIDAKYLNATLAAIFPAILIFPFTKI